MARLRPRWPQSSRCADGGSACRGLPLKWRLIHAACPPRRQAACARRPSGRSKRLPALARALRHARGGLRAALSLPRGRSPLAAAIACARQRRVWRPGQGPRCSTRAGAPGVWILARAPRCCFVRRAGRARLVLPPSGLANLRRGSERRGWPRRPRCDHPCDWARRKPRAVHRVVQAKQSQSGSIAPFFAARLAGGRECPC